MGKKEDEEIYVDLLLNPNVRQDDVKYPIGDLAKAMLIQMQIHKGEHKPHFTKLTHDQLIELLQDELKKRVPDLQIVELPERLKQLEHIACYIYFAWAEGMFALKESE